MRETTLQKKDFLVKKKSPIHGYGIFSSVKIPRGMDFYLVPLNRISSTPAPRLARIAPEIYVSDEKVLNWVNHSCESNSELILEQNKVVLRSKRVISAGEEITLDYYLTEEQKKLVPCSCGLKKCRNFFYITV